MSYYAGQKLYCIDKSHPYYGKKVEVETPLREMKDGTPYVCDPLTGKRIELSADQLGLYLPDERE